MAYPESTGLTEGRYTLPLLLLTKATASGKAPTLSDVYKASLRSLLDTYIVQNEKLLDEAVARKFITEQERNDIYTAAKDLVNLPPSPVLDASLTQQCCKQNESWDKIPELRTGFLAIEKIAFVFPFIKMSAGCRGQVDDAINGLLAVHGDKSFQEMYATKADGATFYARSYGVNRPWQDLCTQN